MSEKQQNQAFVKLHSLAVKGKIFQNFIGSDRSLLVTEGAVEALSELGIRYSHIGEQVRAQYDRDPRYDITTTPYTISFAQVSEAIEKGDKGNPANLELAAAVYNAASAPPYKDGIVDGIVRSGERFDRPR